MSQLRVGDVVRSVDAAGKAIYDEVYFFGHADSSMASDYVSLKLSGSDAPLQLSSKHFLPTCPNRGEQCKWADHIHVYAQKIQPGDSVWISTAGQSILSEVLETTVVVKDGLYNPYTLSGKIVVNGVVASAHSNWVLDEWTPSSMSQYLPAAYQVMFLPGRLMYHVLGTPAADFLDVNNPQLAAAHGHGPEFLGVCFLSGLIIAVTALRSNRLK
jgi:desert hedgehog protein